MDKASMSAKSYEEQQKEDKANKNRSFFSAGFSWLKTQFSSGSHHNVEEVNPVLARASSERPTEEKVEKPIEKKIDAEIENTIEKPKKQEHEGERKHKHRHRSLSKGDSKKELKNHDEKSEPKFNTVSGHSHAHSRKKNRQSGSHVSFNLESTEAASALSGSEDHDLMPPVKKNVFVDIKPMESLAEQTEQADKIIESKLEPKIELPELKPEMSLVSESQEQLEQVPVPVEFEMVSDTKEMKPEEQLQAILDAAPQTMVAQELNQPEPIQQPEEPGEDFSRTIRHRAFEKHKRNSKRLSGQLPNYDEAAFIEGGHDVDFIRTQNGTGRYWNNPGRPGQVAGQINRDQMDGATYQRLGYLASLGNAEAHEKIEAAKNRSSVFKK